MICWRSLEEGRWAYLETRGGDLSPKRNPYPYPSVKNASWARGWEIGAKQEREVASGEK